MLLANNLHVLFKTYFPEVYDQCRRASTYGGQLEIYSYRVASEIMIHSNQ